MCKTYINKTAKELLGDLYTYYYENPDVMLLLDLLAESSGPAYSFRVLALFDNGLITKFIAGNMNISFVEYHKRANVINIVDSDGTASQREKDKEIYDAKVQFSSAQILKQMILPIRDVAYMCTVENSSRATKSEIVLCEKLCSRASVQSSIQSSIIDHKNENTDAVEKRDRGNAKGEEIMLVNETGAAATSSKLLGFALNGLETNKEYMICISTIVNGRLLSKLTRQVKPKIT